MKYMMNQEIAQTILKQIKALEPWALGAWGARSMMLSSEEGFLSFKVTTPKIRRGGLVKVFYDRGSDLYAIKAYRIIGAKITVIGERADVYAEDLVDVIDSLIEG